MNPKSLVSFLILTYTLLIFKCSENPSKPAEPVLQIRDTITINIEQITHRSVSLRLTKKLKAKSDRYVLNRISAADTFAFAPFALAQNDTLIIDDNDGEGLELDKDYSYFAYRLDSLETAKDTSETITAKTLAATSHNFSWTEYTLGNGELRDVWGTDENNVYAVGGITVNDTGYGMAHWDGEKWTPNQDAGGSAIFGFSNEDIWTAGVAISHKEGGEWRRVSHDWIDSKLVIYDQVLYDNTPYTSIWGTSSEDLYFVGRKGKIVFWNGTKAVVKYDAGDHRLLDINGTDSTNIWVVGVDENFDDYVVNYNGKEWNEIIELPYDKLNPATVFSINKRETYLAGNSLVFGMPGTFQNISYPSNIFIDQVRGWGANDLFASGSFGMVMHFNGVKWQRIDPTQNGRYSGIFAIENRVFIVGYSNDKAKIFIGER